MNVYYGYFQRKFECDSSIFEVLFPDMPWRVLGEELPQEGRTQPKTFPSCFRDKGNLVKRLPNFLKNTGKMYILNEYNCKAVFYVTAVVNYCRILATAYEICFIGQGVNIFYC